MPFYLGKAQSRFFGFASQLITTNLQNPREEPGTKQDSPAPALLHLRLCRLVPKEMSLWQACFIWDNTNQVRPVAAWLHLFNAKFQIGCYCHTSVIIFKAKKCCEAWCKDWTNTQPFRIRNKALAFGCAARLCVMLSWDSSALATEVCSRAPIFWLLLQSSNRKTTLPGADPHLK